MKVEAQIKLAFEGVDILNVNFEAIAPPQEDLNIKVELTSAVFYPQENKQIFKIVTDLKVEDERYFTLSLRGVGNFRLSEDLTDDTKKLFVNTNAPAIMFPYLRAFVSTLTANLGESFNSITIPTQFFKGELEEIKL